MLMSLVSHPCKALFIGKSRYYDNKKSRSVKLMEINNQEITVSKNNILEPVINGQPLFTLRNNFPEITGC